MGPRRGSHTRRRATRTARSLYPPAQPRTPHRTPPRAFCRRQSRAPPPVARRHRESPRTSRRQGSGAVRPHGEAAVRTRRTIRSHRSSESRTRGGGRPRRRTTRDTPAAVVAPRAALVAPVASAAASAARRSKTGRSSCSRPRPPVGRTDGATPGFRSRSRRTGRNPTRARSTISARRCAARSCGRRGNRISAVVAPPEVLAATAAAARRLCSREDR